MIATAKPARTLELPSGSWNSTFRRGDKPEYGSPENMASPWAFFQPGHLQCWPRRPTQCGGGRLSATCDPAATRGGPVIPGPGRHCRETVYRIVFRYKCWSGG